MIPINGKGGGGIRNYSIKSPETIFNSEDYAYIVITSAPGLGTIVSYLKAEGVPDEKIITSFVDGPLKAREQFLVNYADLIQGLEGACAECGVFQGDFARVMNSCFKNRRLYLFDTFEGFNEKDISVETGCSYSEAKVNDYAGTSVELVMSKMAYPDQVSVRKGYFPQSAQDITERFCFVNLDLDLYLPTLEGLRWLAGQMVPGGVVLVHDYFSDNFRGVSAAVNEFITEYREKALRLVPIGDGISIAVAGF